MTDEPFAKGKRGLVSLREEGGTVVLVKRRNPDAAVDTIANEACFTELLCAHGVGPRFLRYDQGAGELVREYVVGEEFRRWLPLASGEAVRRVLLAVLVQCRTLDLLGIDKQEMTRPWKHIIVPADGVPVLIDFERCRRSRLPKNVTQFCQFLSGSRLSAALNDKKIMINTQKLLDLSKKYKQKIRDRMNGGPATRETDDVFAEILAEVSRA